VLRLNSGNFIINSKCGFLFLGEAEPTSADNYKVYMIAHDQLRFLYDTEGVKVFNHGRDFIAGMDGLPKSLRIHIIGTQGTMSGNRNPIRGYLIKWIGKLFSCKFVCFIIICRLRDPASKPENIPGNRRYVWKHMDFGEIEGFGGAEFER